MLKSGSDWKCSNGSVNGSSNSLEGQIMFNKSFQVYYVTYISETYFVQDDDIAWRVNSGATIQLCKDRCWFKACQSLHDRLILHMGNDLTTLVYGRGCVDLRFSSRKIVFLFNVLHVPNIRKSLVSINDIVNLAFISTSKLNNSIIWHARLGRVHFKRMQDMFKDGLIPDFDMDIENYKTCMLTKITKNPFQNIKRETKVLELIHSDLCDLHATPSLGNKKYFVTFIDDAFRAVVRLPDPKLKTLGKRGIECIFVGYVKHSKAFRFYYPDQVSRFLMDLKTLVYQRSQMKFLQGSLKKSLKDEILVQQPGPGLLRKTRDEVSDKYSYCFNVGGDPNSFHEAMKSQDVAFWKEAINDEMDSIMGNNTWVLVNLPPGCKPLGCKWIFKKKMKVDGIVEKFKASTIRLLIALVSIHTLIVHSRDVKIAFLNGELDEEVYMNQPRGFIMPDNEVDPTEELLSTRFSMKDIGEADVILGIMIKHERNGISISQSHYIEKVLEKLSYFDCPLMSTPIDTSEKLRPNNGQAVSLLEYSRVIGYMMYVMTCIRPNIAFVVVKLILEEYTDASWINNSEDNSSIISWAFLLEGGAISWASKKQTCITSLTMKSEFVALAAARKEAEWLKNLILKIPLWYKPIAPISIHFDSATTLAKAYSQMYNGKSRHLGVRNNMIRELIMNGVVSI
ncbi:zinc finger, CCHC-type containing protein [Tanacetum coccineum]